MNKKCKVYTRSMKKTHPVPDDKAAAAAKKKDDGDYGNFQ